MFRRQSAKTITIAGISHTVGEDDTDNWKGIPVANGTCEISLNDDNSVKFKWSGGNESGGKKYPFKINEDLQAPLLKSGVLDLLLQNPKNNYEIDSRCKQSTNNMVNRVKEKIEANSLLQHGTWAYLKRPDTKDNYLFWTSVNTDVVGAGKTIPVLINNGNSFYISETTTATRNPDSKTNKYVAISGHLVSGKDFQNILSKGQPYDTLQDAYDAYEKLLTENKQYEEYKDTLPKS